MTTPNHELNTPSEGERDWHLPLNENTATLDVLVEVRDVDANKSDYAPKDGAKFLATDTGTVYLGDGNDWTPLGGITEAGTRNARDYDGDVGGDCIQAALNDAATTDTARVVVNGVGPDDLSGHQNALRPRGWLLQSALEIPDRTTLEFRDSYLFLDDNTDENLVRNAAAPSADAARNSDIHILGDHSTLLDGNATGQNRSPAPDKSQTEPGALEHFGIFLHKVDRCRIGGFQIGRTGGWGVAVQDFTDCAMENLNFRQDAAVWNQDGCSFIGPGTRGLITGITGQFGDDFATVYCTADWLNDGVGSGGDVSNVVITDSTVSPAPEATLEPGVRLQTGKGTSLSDVVISNVALDSGHIKLVNENDPASFNDLQHVSISDVTSAGAVGGLEIGGPVQDVSMSNVHVWDSTDVFVSVNWDVGTSEPARVRNLTVENCTVESDGALFYTGPDGGNLTDVTFHDVSYSTVSGGDGNGARLLFYNSHGARDVTLVNMRIDGDPVSEGLYVDSDFTLENVFANNLHFTNVKDAVSIQSAAIRPPVRFSNVTAGPHSGETYNVAPSGVVTDGLGTESANADTPTVDTWSTGDVVAFTDTGDGSGSGVYLLLPDGNWSLLGAT